jgi:hypothetical protein
VFVTSEKIKMDIAAGGSYSAGSAEGKTALADCGKKFMEIGSLYKIRE